MKYLKGLCFFVFLYVLPVHSATVDTVSTYSTSMNKNIKAVIITPDNYSENKKFPVVYLLHGYSGSYKDWIQKVPKLKKYVDRYEMIVVCPDGDFNSWYFDSPIMKDEKYETYISKELIIWVDNNYSTVKDRKGRAITGLSMGGHGALYLAFRHQDIYSSAGSISGGVDLRPFPNNWDISKYLGAFSEYPDRWKSHSVVSLTHLLTPDSLNIIFQCGTEDFFYKVNVKLHEKLLYMGIQHTFISSPGKHTWDFWRNGIKYQLEFFNTHFESLKN